MGRKVLSKAIILIQPFGEYTNRVLSQWLNGEGFLELRVKPGEPAAKFWTVSEDELEALRVSQKTDGSLHFAVWRKGVLNGRVELCEPDLPVPRRVFGQGLQNSLKNGLGEPIKIPRPASKRRSHVSGGVLPANLL